MKYCSNKGQDVSTRIVDPTERTCTMKSAIREDQASSKSKSLFQKPWRYPQPSEVWLTTKSTTKAYEIGFGGEDGDKAARDGTGEFMNFSKLVR